ncbi:MAG: glycosyltransferase, partial [Desulfarculaceae bacterium]
SQQQDFTSAASAYCEMADAAPQDWGARNRLALCLMMSGERDQAVTEMQKAVELSPQDPTLLANLAKMHLVAEEWQKALNIFEQALELAQDPLKSEIEPLLQHCRSHLADSASPADPPEDKASAPCEARAASIHINERFNILFVQEAPCIRNYKECCALRSRGHGVTLAYTKARLSQLYRLSDDIYEACVQIANPQQLWDLSKNFDVVHCHNEPDLWTVAALAGDKPVVHDTHDLISLRQPGDQSIAFFETLANRGADGRVYVSDYLLQTAMAQYGADPKTSLVLHNYVGADMLPREQLPKLSAQDGQIHLVYEGGLTHEAGTHRSFLPLFTELAQEGFNVHIHPAFANPVFEKTAADHARLHYYQPCSPEELLTFLTRYDYGLVPFMIQPHNRRHLDSALPNKLFEYLAAGLPVIATNLQSLREFITTKQVGLVYDRAVDVAPQLKGVRSFSVDQNQFTMECAIGDMEGLYARLKGTGKRIRAAA